MHVYVVMKTKLMGFAWGQFLLDWGGCTLVSVYRRFHIISLWLQLMLHVGGLCPLACCVWGVHALAYPTHLASRLVSRAACLWEQSIRFGSGVGHQVILPASALQPA